MGNIQEVLHDRFGFEGFNPGQQEVIEHLLSGRSALALFPTGGGKSLCYQLPALILPGLTLVVSPLIALMKDQIDFLKQKGIMAERMDSTMEPEETREVMTRYRQGQLRLFYVAPERFTNERFFQTIQRVKIDLFAVDEAHCISEWGHNFRPDYLKLAKIVRELGIPRVLALTATATPQVVRDICTGFGISPDCAVKTGFYRPNLAIKTTAVSSKDRDEVLLRRLHETSVKPTIVYVTRQKTSEEIAEMLNKHNIPAKAYHAGLDREARIQIQEWFMSSDQAVVVATIAFGMGIDKANIRQVIHYNLPKSLENYSQEMGRAGRDGVTSFCEILASSEDLNILENFVYGDTPTRSAIAGVLREVFAREKEFHLNLYDLSFDYDIRLSVLRTLLTYLELEGYISERGAFFAGYSFQPIVSLEEIIQRFPGERGQFLAGLFQQAKKGRTWYHIDVDETAKDLNQPRERIIRALDYLHEKAFLSLRTGGERHKYILLRQPDDILQLGNHLFHRFVERESRDIQRIQQVLDLVTLHGCQTNYLVGYFGEERSIDCGHCNWCMNGNRQVILKSVPEFSLTRDILEEIESVRQEQKEIFSEPRALARFLCGITSPRITRAKLSSHPSFGLTAGMRFNQVLENLESKL